MATRDPTPILLDGVTGGGKTAIYVEAIAASLEAGRPALLLVPEIALATPIVDRLRAELPVRIALVHSGLGEGERADEWRRIRAGDVDLVVGTRTALLAPLADVGLIVVDEEHDPAYKSDRTPRFQARDAALELGRLAGAAVVLGSATPVGRVDGPRARRPLPARRAAGPAAAARSRSVTAVDLRAELAAGNRGLLSGALADALRGARHGGRRPRDPRHEPPRDRVGRPVPGLRHGPGVPGLRAAARLPPGGHDAPLPPLRPRLADRDALPVVRARRGSGTSAAARSASSARCGTGSRTCGSRRLDRDIVERKGAAERVLDGFAAGRSDVLVGTSLVAKGLDIPEVTLVGVVSADIALNLPDERASERTYQLLAQAVGRAGRGDRPGRAIVQTYRPEHRAIRAVVEGDATTFYDEELALRERFGSPPFGRLVKLTVALPDREAAEREGVAMADRLRDRGRASSACRSRSPGPRRPTSRGAATAGGSTSSCAARTRSRCWTRRRGRRGAWTSTRSRCCNAAPGRGPIGRWPDRDPVGQCARPTTRTSRTARGGTSDDRPVSQRHAAGRRARRASPPDARRRGRRRAGHARVPRVDRPAPVDDQRHRHAGRAGRQGDRRQGGRARRGRRRQGGSRRPARGGAHHRVRQPVRREGPVRRRGPAHVRPPPTPRPPANGSTNGTGDGHDAVRTRPTPAPDGDDRHAASSHPGADAALAILRRHERPPHRPPRRPAPPPARARPSTASASSCTSCSTT